MYTTGCERILYGSPTHLLQQDRSSRIRHPHLSGVHRIRGWDRSSGSVHGTEPTAYSWETHTRHQGYHGGVVPNYVSTREGVG